MPRPVALYRDTLFIEGMVILIVTAFCSMQVAGTVDLHVLNAK
jgi:hypothetical protein